MWRKTKSTGPSADCVGTDGNRNWDAFWSIGNAFMKLINHKHVKQCLFCYDQTNLVPGSSPDPCSSIYHGPTAASESEVRNLANYIQSFGDGYFDAYISTHSASQLILYPYIYKENEISDDDEALVRRCLISAVPEISCSHFAATNFTGRSSEVNERCYTRSSRKRVCLRTWIDHYL